MYLRACVNKINDMCLRVSPGGLDEGTGYPRNTYLFGAIATINRKAPAEMQGLFQFDLRLVGDGGLEPSTPCL